MSEPEHKTEDKHYRDDEPKIAITGPDWATEETKEPAPKAESPPP